MDARESREAAAAAIEQRGMAHDGIVDFLEGADAVTAAQKLSNLKAQRIPKRRKPLEKDSSMPQRHASGKPKAKLRVAVPMRKRT